MPTPKYNLSGKTVVITGATSGIGLAAATEFAQQEAFVIGVGRSEIRNQQAEHFILTKKPKGGVVYLQADLAQQEEVFELGRKINSTLSRNQLKHVDILINNAGVYQEKKHLTVDKIEMTFAVNHLAAFILTHELIPRLNSAESGRVITVSSKSHRNTPLNLERIANPWPYFGLLAYKGSKLCNILFTNELNRRCPLIEAYAVDPGLVKTAIASKGEPGISDWVWRMHSKKGTSPEVPVQTLFFLAGEKQIDKSKSHLFRDCQPLLPSRKATDMELGHKLWAHSCQLTGISWV